MQRRFILGIGAQKAGTTWLSDYLRGDPAFRTGPITTKELHIWDRTDLALFHPYRRRLLTCRSVQDLVLLALQRRPALYFTYFGLLLRRGGLAADLSPSYAGLSAARLGQIDASFARRDIDMRTVFIMRDPVRRCVSAFNMIQSRAPTDPEATFRASDDDETAFHAHFRSAHCHLRTDYAATLQAMESALDPARCSVQFYETLFDPEPLAALSAFAGVAYRPEQVSVTSNGAQRCATLSDHALRACAQHYRATYETVAARYPQVLRLWSGFRYLD